MFWIETALFAYPLVVWLPTARENGKQLALRRGQHDPGGLAATVRRLPGHVQPGRRLQLFSALPEVMVTVSMIAAEIAFPLHHQEIWCCRANSAPPDPDHAKETSVAKRIT